MKSAYYLAASRTLHGDPEYAQACELAWLATGHTSPGRYDGVSMWGDETRIVYVDFFVREHPPVVGEL